MPPLRSGTGKACDGPLPAAVRPWGDGFASDGLFELWAVRDWSLCASDEYVLFFPRLIPPAGEFPHPLRAHLESCVGVRAWRLAQLDDGDAPLPLRSRPIGSEDAAVRHRDWFTDDGAVTCLMRRIGLLRTAPERIAAERDLLTFLDRVLAEVQAQRVPAWDETSEALLAFGAGIHPSYLWPQATVSPARGVAAGWLGHLDRGRPALMPLVVAEYILDALGGGDAGDRQLAKLAGSVVSLDILRRAARCRWAGRDTTVRRTSEAVWPKGGLAAWGQSAAEANA